ncbi:MAG: GTP-binding protein, partial [Candidatus Omnitrophica bacterium]|nr:GTP-binding protein [Candidatus Omnitrophota bacterium]
MNSDLTKKRTFLLCGHAQSGKTSLTEAILFKSQTISRLGTVSSGSTTSDYEDDEKERESSINLSVLTADYKGNTLQFIDTPGYLDFIGEVIMASRAADFAVIVVDAVEGVGVGTEKAWDIVRKENLPCLFFINKLDKENTDYNQTLDDIRQSLTKKAISLGIVEGKNITSILKNKDKEKSSYSKIVESVAESDDQLCEKYLETGTLDEKEVNTALNKAVINAQFFPVIGGVATEEIGVEFLLDAITEIMPSVAEAKKRTAKDQEAKEQIIEPKVEDPFCAQVFKTVIDPFV